MTSLSTLARAARVIATGTRRDQFFSWTDFGRVPCYRGNGLDEITDLGDGGSFFVADARYLWGCHRAKSDRRRSDERRRLSNRSRRRFGNIGLERAGLTAQGSFGAP